MEVLEKELEELLLKKSFDELTNFEKNYVSLYLTEDEYRNYRLFLVRATGSLNKSLPGLQPDSSTKDKLLQAFRNKHKRQIITFTLFSQQRKSFIPSMVALGILIVGGVLFGFYGNFSSVTFEKTAGKTTETLESNAELRGAELLTNSEFASKPSVKVRKENLIFRSKKAQKFIDAPGFKESEETPGYSLPLDTLGGGSVEIPGFTTTAIEPENPRSYDN